MPARACEVSSAVRRAADAERGDERAVAVDPGEAGGEAGSVLDVDEDAVHAVDDEVGRLPGTARDERDAGRHRLEHALRPALLPRGDDVRVERVVRGRRARRDREGAGGRRARRAARAPAGRSRGPGPVSRTTRPAISRRARSSASTSTSGALDRLRLEAVPEADAVLLERADDERVRGEAQELAGRPPQLGVARREAVELDADRDAVHARRLDARQRGRAPPSPGA